MPELPEVETTVRAINQFENSFLKKIVIHNKNLRWEVESAIQESTKNKLVKKIVDAYKNIENNS